jgi:hypothetical protein
MQWVIFFIVVILYRLFIRLYMHQRIMTRGTTEDESSQQQHAEVQVVGQEPYPNLEWYS